MAEAERQRTLGELRAELARRDAKIVQLESSVTDVTVAMAAVRSRSQTPLPMRWAITVRLLRLRRTA